MNEEMQIKIIDLMDDGATLDNSPELKELVHSSEETRSFYESILVSESAIKDFFGGDKSKELSNKIDAFVEEQFNNCLLYTSPSPRDRTRSRMPSSA